MASIADNYEINVEKKVEGRPYSLHYCKIELPYSLREEAETKLEELRKIFGDEYHLSMTHWICRGSHDEESWK